MQGLKDRHHIVYRSIQRESDVTAMMTVSNILNEYALSDIYNVDEIGLFYQILQSKIMEISGKKFEGGKANKQHITVLLCINMNGSYNQKTPSLPVIYRNNPNHG